MNKPTSLIAHKNNMIYENKNSSYQNNQTPSRLTFAGFNAKKHDLGK